MRAEDDLCAVVDKITDSGKGSDNSLVARDNAVFDFYIEIAAYEDSFALDIKIFNGLFVECTHWKYSFVYDLIFLRLYGKTFR